MKVELLIANMTCNHCSRRVQSALESTFQDTKVNVDLAKKIAVLEGEGPFDASLLKSVIEDAGYELVKVFNF